MGDGTLLKTYFNEKKTCLSLSHCAWGYAGEETEIVIIQLKLFGRRLVYFAWTIDLFSF